MTVSDTELMRRLAVGDQAAFAVLLDRHAATVLNVLYRIVLSRDDAEDLCQEVFEKLWHQAGQWQDWAKLSTWLFRVASNLAINHRQRFQQRHIVDEGLAIQLSDEAQSVPSQPGLEGELRHRQQGIASALSALPENQRAAMVFRYYQGLAVKEIAEIMAIGPKAVATAAG